MNNKLEYLRKYEKNIEIVDFSTLGNNTLNIPEQWLAILEEENQSLKIDKLITLWNSVCAFELRNTIEYFKNNLITLDLLYNGEEYSILYGIKSSKDEILYYEGKLGINLDKNIELKAYWDKIPKSVCKFYENLHNGFYYYASHSMGLVPEDEVTNFCEYDWSIIEELDEPIKIDVNSTFGFFSNGMGAYVAIDGENCVNENSTLWFKNKQPKYNLNFWDVVDEWIVIGFQV
ncbi:SMI1/KNR4 family protein [Bacillus sp. XF8]|uniref:SMI1/KNR4 family protein n=1 Tax=Bacillus sp. XF8 TaxID=2819289 RepID=UPI001AA01DFD|nr:SMI1/KNR4 family protein [Bacillus sp. XF8]MBO1580113.1 SMI1/KNR4 family protein [Bacillus sp. XF8]